MTNTALKPCSCRKFEAGTRVDLPNGDVDFINVRTTGCNASTTRLFAQGHDAKLVSFLVAAELDGLEIALVDGSTSWGEAKFAAGSISDALYTKAADMVAVAHRKAERKANKPAKATKGAQVQAIQARQAEAEAELLAQPVIAPRWVAIKVGRWTYDAKIDPTTEVATYSAKLGGTKTAQPGEYRVV